MSPVRFREDDSHVTGTVAAAITGALAGFAVGMLVAQRVGGIDGLRQRIRRSLQETMEPEATRHGAEVGDYHDYDDDIEDDFDESWDRDEEIEERVLEAFRNDPVLCERAVDIGSIGEGIVELAGWVDSEEEATHAVTVARGVPDVVTVVNRLGIGDQEEAFEDAARRVREGDPALTEAHWEGVRVGTGKRRQGTSDEPDRHADPAVGLEERWLDTGEAIRNAADDTGGSAERRARVAKRVRGDRTGGSPVSPTGVPKADHVADPENA
jgi:osmotically-inducible protein OsmY